MYLNDKEEALIDVFMGNLDEYERLPMILKWKRGGQALVRLDTCFEDEDDDEQAPDFEEYVSFIFEALSIDGNPPIDIYDNYFIVNYRNFPNEILVDGRKIN